MTTKKTVPYHPSWKGIDRLPPEKAQCEGPCHKYDNVFCLDRCCPECKTELSIDRMT